MIGQNAGQLTLFAITQLAGSDEVPTADPQVPTRSSGPELTSSFAGQSGRMEAGPFQAVSPFANLPLREVCASCGAEVRAPGYVIQDYEELGAFCNEQCGDKRFRLYLNDTAEEGSELDDEQPNDCD